MANEKPTPIEAAAEVAGGAIDGRIFRIDAEIAELQKAAERIVDLQAERAELVKLQTSVNVNRKKPATDDKVK